MKKILYATVLVSMMIFFSVASVSANWYGDTWEPKGGVRSCSSDGDTTGGAGSSTDSRVISQSGTQMLCQRWDGQNPESLSLDYVGGWINQTQTITVQALDRGGSRLKQIILEESQNSGAWTQVANWDNLNSQNTLVTRTFDRVPLDNATFRYRMHVYDYAGNTQTIESSNLIQFDIIPPSIDDILNNIPEHLLANDSYTYTFEVGNNGGSSINTIAGNYELGDNPGAVSEFSSLGAFFSQNIDISQVDNDRIDGAREYNFTITQICDEAGNCWNGAEVFTHYIYANTLDIIATILNPLAQIVPADGTAQDIVITLVDNYGNQLVPASNISRTIDMNLYANNHLRLNQYSNTGNESAIFIGDVNTALDIGNNVGANLNNIISTDGQYNIPLYVFASTSNTDSFVPGYARINEITYDVNDTEFGIINNQPLSVSFDFQVSPLYTSNISGDIIENGFIEGAEQRNTLDIFSLNSANITNPSLYLEFGTPNTINTSSDNFSLQYGLGGASFDEGWSSLDQRTPFQNSLGNESYDFTTFLLQVPSPVSNTQSYLASIISYNLLGKNISYPSDIFGKNSYHGTSNGYNTVQDGIFIEGVTYSQNINSLTSSQSGSGDINEISGDVYKSLVRRDIHKNVYNTFKNITPENVTSRLNDFDFSDNESGVELGDILYFSSGTTVEVQGGTVFGRKTVVTIGTNIFITGNILNSSSSDILGIISMQDDNGNGGNIFIHPDVTNIEAILYADLTLASSNDGVNTLEGALLPASALANQLYIHGSVFSENTVGGSRSSPLVCPYFVPDGTCTLQESQKYDLNYIRRYYQIDDGSGNMVPANGGISSVGTSKTNPIVIEYNPQVQLTPPPLFEIK
ncbi:hypothetical protein MK079_02725 [Candidatus Gracilibacteria bacterium]|nr:hypothetical protein [Candidatus Gracilibacteria bacterium]